MLTFILLVHPAGDFPIGLAMENQHTQRKHLFIWDVNIHFVGSPIQLGIFQLGWPWKISTLNENIPKFKN